MRSFRPVKKRNSNIFYSCFFIFVICISSISLFLAFDSNSRPISNLKSNTTNLQNTPFRPSYNARDLISVNNIQDSPNFTGEGVTAAILDTGIRANHFAFTDAGRLNWDERILAFWDEEKNGLSDNPEDIYWHGTWTASILGGNSTDYQGIAPDVNFIIMKVFEYNEDDEIVSNPDIVEKAVDWLIENKEKYNIRIVSMSFGAEIDADNEAEIERLHNMVDRLFEQDILVVGSAGNYGDGENTITAPASARSALAVGGINEEGETYSKSGRGPTAEGIIKPDVCAPAVSVLGASKEGDMDDYISRSGTSASAPMVAGLAALMLEKDNDLTSKELKSIISMTAIRTADQQTIKDNNQGWGLVKGYAALAALEGFNAISQDFQFKFDLDQEASVICLPLTFSEGQHFLELSSLDSLKAEMFLFQAEADTYGNPQLVADSLSLYTQASSRQRIGFFTSIKQNYYLVIKALLSSGTDGSFHIMLVFDERVLFILLLFGLNIVSLIYLVMRFIRKRDLK